MNIQVSQEQAVDYDPFAGEPVLKIVPSTEAQREVWLADQLGVEASLAYNESVSLLWRGAMEVLALKQALDDVMERHEALRGKFGSDGTDLWIGAEAHLPLECIDLSAQDAATAKSHAAAERLRAVESPFDLTTAPLVRAVLLKFAEDQYELILSAHHIVCDGWSFGIIIRDLMAFYRAHRAGAAPTMGPSHAFGDYALSLIEPAAQQQFAVDQAYWTSMYDSSVPVLDLPCDRPRQPLRSFASRREDLLIPADVVEMIRRRGAQQGASLFATLFGVFSALVGRLSGQDDVVIGVAAAGQATLENSNLVGHCVNLLPIRTQLSGLTSLSDVVQAAGRNVLDAYEHQQCTFGTLLQKLQLTRDPSRLPLVSILFNLDQGMSEAELSEPGLQVTVRSNARQYENFELFLNISRVTEGLMLECQYQTALFDRETMQRWLELFVLALQRYAAQPALDVAAALAPGPADMALLEDINATAAEYDRTQRIDTLIGRQAAAAPTAVAIRCSGRTVTYGALEQAAETVAQTLRDRGVGPGDLVGLACGRNECMFMGLYGILKAGAAYVPLDPDFPVDRLEFMCADAKLKLVVTDASIQGEWKFGTATPLFVGSPDPLAEALPLRDIPAVSDRTHDVAYVIYTSGSTGRPKGVRVTHCQCDQSVGEFTKTLGLDRGDRVLSVTTLSFDIAVMETILPLTVGASVVISDRSQAKFGDQLRALIEEQEVSFINATPSTWRLLLAAEWPGRHDLRAFCGGEPFASDLAAALLPRVGALWNVYGPTETTVWSSLYRVERASPTVPIGRPIANTQLHVLDAALRPLPIGVVGELYIGGEGVTLGYLDRPELTAERFLPDPFSTRAGARVYRTGDLGRVRNDGVIECLGRVDHQVKVRGYRIELGEIEAVLSEFPGLDRVLVITREDRPGDVRIVAYVVPNAGMPSVEDLRLHASRRLPDYMVPQHFLALEAIPLLPNGKVDRRALPSPDMSRVATAKRVAPQNALQAAVLSAMEDVLNLPGMGMREDFFALGGHSLLASRLIARLNRDFEIRLPLRALFELPTAEGLSRAVDEARGVSVPAREPLVALPDRRSAPLTPMQARMRFIEEMHPGSLLYNTPSAHRLIGPMDTALFTEALQLLIVRQPSLRTYVHPADSGTGYEQRILEHFEVSVPYHDMTSLPADQRDDKLLEALQAEVDRPLDTGQPPLFRVGLYRLGQDDHVFFFMPHHIIWDGWSFDLLYEELGAIYEALLNRKSVALAPLQITYGDYAEWFARWLDGPEAAAQLTYWRERYAKMPVAKALRSDFPRGPGMTGAGGSEWLNIDAHLTEELRSIGTSVHATLNMLTMSAYAVLIASAIDASGVVIGMPVRGRALGEVESVMGFFNNLLPVHLHVPRISGSSISWQPSRRNCWRFSVTRTCPSSVSHGNRRLRPDRVPACIKPCSRSRMHATGSAAGVLSSRRTSLYIRKARPRISACG